MLAASAVVLGWGPPAGAASLTPGDVVVERDGNGGVEALTSAATPIRLDEFGPVGGLAATIELPTTESGANKPLLDSGAASSDGGLTLSGNGECLLTVGINAKPGTEKVLETKASTNPRVVAVVNGKGEVDTTTALTNFANENNPRSATSSDCKQLWVGGNGTKTTGGVIVTELGQNHGNPAQRRQERPRRGDRRQPALRLSRAREARKRDGRHRRQRAADDGKTPITDLPFATLTGRTLCLQPAHARARQHARHALRRRQTKRRRNRRRGQVRT